jgi:hypothetical protein
MGDASLEYRERVKWEVIWILVVLSVAAVALLPLGRAALLWQIVRAFMLLWGVMLMSAWALQRVQELLRVVDDPPSDAYVLSNLAVGAALLVAWTGCTALLIRESATGAPVWVAAILHAIGFVASHAAYSTLTVIYGGTIYRTVNLFVALGGFVLFAAWPPAARALFGWLV